MQNHPSFKIISELAATDKYNYAGYLERCASERLPYVSFAVFASTVEIIEESLKLEAATAGQAFIEASKRLDSAPKPPEFKCCGGGKVL